MRRALCIKNLSRGRWVVKYVEAKRGGWKELYTYITIYHKKSDAAAEAAFMAVNMNIHCIHSSELTEA